MGTLDTAYRILYALEHKTGTPEIGPAKIKTDPEKWAEVLQGLIDEGYIANVDIRENILGEKEINTDRARITLKGAEYLRENSAMRKIAVALGHIVSAVK